MPLVDVVVPAYNAARFLPASLDSVVAQSSADWRILLIDDGSTDGTPELVRPYQDRLGERLKYVRQENAGLPAARNTAIRHSSAEFLALLDADDVWLPQRLERSLERFRQQPEAGLVYGFNARIDPQGKVLDVFDRRNRHAEGWVAPYLYMRSLDLPCPTVTFRRRCVEEVGGFDESMRATEDRDLWLRIAQRYPVALVPEVIAHYRVSPGAMSGDPDRMLRSQMQFTEKHFGERGCDRRARRVAMGWIYRQHAEALAEKGSLQPALASALRALTRDPMDAHNLRTAVSLSLRSFGLTHRSARKLAQ